MVSRASRSLSSAQYEPGPVPDNPADLSRYLGDELLKLAAVVKLLAAGHLDVCYQEPAKPRMGDTRYADGVQWNPGGGEGIYLYNSVGQWIQLG